MHKNRETSPMHPNPLSLPAGMTVLERGWLSANNIVFAAAHGDMEGSAVVDTGYVSHSAQTLALIDMSPPRRRHAVAHAFTQACGLPPSGCSAANSSPPRAWEERHGSASARAPRR